MAAEQPGLRDHRKFGAADPEARPDRPGAAADPRPYSMVSDEALNPYLTPSTSENNPGPCNTPSAIRSRARWQSPLSNNSSSGHHADGPDTGRHLANVGGRIDHHLAARVHGVEIERADIWTQDFDMFDPAFRRDQGGARTGHLGIGFDGTNRPPGPVVRLMIRPDSWPGCGPSRRDTNRSTSTAGRFWESRT